ncbi:hypothetical protein [Lewinella cohaerens]|uniref:hypothetical protein n=1 Tax=Lewinella cohaerens TaxID=70995 RepID=UPI000376C629|nr:hypothetical protein [Lewinella cohaerens]
MQEFDLQELWGQANDRAEAWYDRLRPDLVATARQKNDSVLQRIRRLVQGELLFSTAAFVGLLFYWQDFHPLFLILMESTILLVMIIAYRYYRRFTSDIEAVPAMNIVASTEAYLNILNTYKTRLVRLSIFLMPVGLIIGFMAGFGLGNKNDFSAFSSSKFWLTTIPALIAIAIPTYYFTLWYYRFFIGSKEKELAAVLERLRQEE